MLKQSRELENKSASAEEVDKKQVIEVMMDKWDAGRQEEKNIAGSCIQMYKVSYFRPKKKKSYYETKKFINNILSLKPLS